MILKKVFGFTSALIILIYFTGCTDLFTNTASGPNPSKLSVTIHSPVSDDSISYKGINVNYDVTTDLGVTAIELYVNGQSFRWYASSDGSKPAVPIPIDSTWIGQRFSYFLVYFDKDGSSVRSDTIKNILVTEVRTPPAPPYSIVLTPINGTAINIAWQDSASSSSTGYEIWRKVGFWGTFALQISSPPNTFNTNDNNFKDTTVYYYKMRGVNTFGYSSFSSIVNTYGDGALRSIPPPTNLKAVALAGNIIKLTWDDVGINENYFKIERRYDWSSYTSVAYANKGAVAFVDSANGLTPGLNYHYRVKAVSSKDSSWSNEVVTTTLN